jgi:hypothetical protein
MRSGSRCPSAAEIRSREVIGAGVMRPSVTGDCGAPKGRPASALRRRRSRPSISYRCGSAHAAPSPTSRIVLSTPHARCPVTNEPGSCCRPGVHAAPSPTSPDRVAGRACTLPRHLRRAFVFGGGRRSRPCHARRGFVNGENLGTGTAEPLKSRWAAGTRSDSPADSTTQTRKRLGCDARGWAATPGVGLRRAGLAARPGLRRRGRNAGAATPGLRRRPSDAASIDAVDDGRE